MDGRILKIFGERNTGTRALGQMLADLPGVKRRIGPLPELGPEQAAVAARIDAQLSGKWRRHYRNALWDEAFGRAAPDDPWKHAVPLLTPGMVGARVATLIMVRNPYSWALSLWKRPYHQVGPRAESFEDFLALPWMTERREGAPAVLSSVVDLWSLKVRASLDYRVAAQVAGLGCEVIRFEDFVQEPEAVVSRALVALDLPDGPLNPVDENTKPDGVPVAAIRRRYGQELWRAELSEDAVASINARLDPGLLAALGYDWIEPRDVGGAVAAMSGT